jgi:hypothetical protein
VCQNVGLSDYDRYLDRREGSEHRARSPSPQQAEPSPHPSPASMSALPALLASPARQARLRSPPPAANAGPSTSHPDGARNADDGSEQPPAIQAEAPPSAHQALMQSLQRANEQLQLERQVTARRREGREMRGRASRC